MKFFCHAVFPFLLLSTAVSALSSSSAKAISPALSTHASTIASLKSKYPLPDDVGDLFYLRHILACEDGERAGKDVAESVAASVDWRKSPRGSDICSRASAAVSAAKAGGGWKNDPVAEGAPSSALVGQYITPDVALTTTDSMGNLVYCIRAGCIEDAALMDSVSNDEMVDFFLYVKEVHRIVADTQSLERGSLVKVVTVNDLYGVSLLSGEKRFRDALSSSSKIGSSVFPELNSVTMLLNLPLLLNAIVGLFKPIFPATVRAKLRFKSGPLGKSVGSLSEVAPGGEKREIFLGQLADLLKEE